MLSCVVSVVTWNSIQDIEQCFLAITRQTYKDFGVVFIDNASSDGTRERLQRYIDISKFRHIEIILNKDNLGFSAAHNQGIRHAKEKGAEYVLVLNPDVVLAPQALQALVAAMHRHPRAGSVGLPLFRDALFIDSFGLSLRQSGKVEERYAGGRRDDVLPLSRDHDEEVFGLSGAGVLYRLAALRDIAYDQQGTSEYFDEDFFAYKEDVDLAFRLHRRGWESWLTHASHAMHRRGVGSHHARAKRSLRLRMLSYKNHLIILFVHRLFSVCSWWRVVLYEVGKGLYLLLREPRVFLASWKEIIVQRQRIRAKRAQIEKRATVSLREVQEKLSHFS